MRIGNGYDVHRLAENRRLILGGVDVPFEKGLLGHSDADVLVHAIIDALLGACALGDIGRHFPDNDEAYKDADSLELLKKVVTLVRGKGYEIENIDSVIAAQSPKLSPFIDKMRENIAFCCEIELDRVSVKATTEEGLGVSGSGLGISSYSVVLLK